MDVNESALAVMAKAGDVDAFGELVDRYSAQARRVARAVLSDPDDGDDAAQDAFLSALKHLNRYDPSRPFGPWLMRIVANAAADHVAVLPSPATVVVSLAALKSPPAVVHVLVLKNV